MALFDLLGRRWTLTVIWALRGGPMTFREIQGHVVGIATSVLNKRLRELRDAGIVEAGGQGYELTEIGRSLLVAGAPIAAWAEAWAEQTG